MAYEANPLLAETTLGLDEIQNLLSENGKSIQRDPRKLMHFLRRVATTIQLGATQRRGLQDQIRDLQLRQEQAGFATTLDPQDAIKYLNPAQLAQHVEGHLRERVAIAERMREDASRTRRQVNQELAQLRFAVASLEEDPAIPAEIKARFTKLRQDAPAATAEPAPVPAAPSSDDLQQLFDA